jgi:PTH2 family peptidyl-tRNA hydrolase
MVLVVRGELRLTAGKAAVQVAHAAVDLVELCHAKFPRELETWMSQGQKKIAVVASTLDILEDLQRRARNLRLPTALVQDAGLTEVPPGTITVLGIGPAAGSQLDPLTGDLPLL